MNQLTMLSEALHKRGFLVTKNDDHIYFQKGNHPKDIHLLKEVFEKLSIPVTIQDRKIHLSEEKLVNQTIDYGTIVWLPIQSHGIAEDNTTRE
ncbi:hypothetical protein [Evansella tamaricis]|uniref:Uncharacterized protein n=1 Tax=Evansella tamaricis TaxID=2069301 RepID=A0ABS6JE55_9BACI|nr:hypothetical protein [Evansella tamaricis]MBU9711957.1 hypothetical protein [Evansella tamaricis]